MKRRSLAVAAIIFVIALLLLALFSTAPAHAQQSWIVQTVGTAAGRGSNGYCPIAVDQGNTPHIAYTDLEADNSFSVRYARWNSALNGFSTQKLARGYATDITLDSFGDPVILCGSGGLQYVTWNGAGWDFQKVDDGNYGVIALDSHGNPHAAYTTGQTLKYASSSGSTWTTETVDNGTEIPLHLSLVLDSNDKPYVFYSNRPDWKLATLENSGWNIETVPLPDSVSPDSLVGVGNMVLDSKGRPHLIYSIGSISGDKTIKYASWTGFSWKTQTVASGLTLYDNRYPGVLALDALDYPHICYVGGLEGWELGYAGWTGANWNIQTADSAIGRNPLYMAVDSNRVPHISYRRGPINSPTSVLFYVTASEPVPLASPLLIALPLLLLVAAVVISATVIVAYLWKKKT